MNPFENMYSFGVFKTWVGCYI